MGQTLHTHSAAVRQNDRIKLLQSGRGKGLCLLAPRCPQRQPLVVLPVKHKPLRTLSPHGNIHPITHFAQFSSLPVPSPTFLLPVFSPTFPPIFIPTIPNQPPLSSPPWLRLDSVALPAAFQTPFILCRLKYRTKTALPPYQENHVLNIDHLLQQASKLCDFMNSVLGV